jgi:hypothetical protein
VRLGLERSAISGAVDVWTFVGAGIIVAATSYLAHREARTGDGGR